MKTDILGEALYQAIEVYKEVSLRSCTAYSNLYWQDCLQLWRVCSLGDADDVAKVIHRCTVRNFNQCVNPTGLSILS